MRQLTSHATRGGMRGSTLMAWVFVILIGVVISGTALVTMQMHRSQQTATKSSTALLAAGDRVHQALSEVNSVRTGQPLARIANRDGQKVCGAQGTCTTLRATMDGTRIRLALNATTPDGGTAARVAYLQQLPTSGIITGVDSAGRVEFVQDGGTGTDLWTLEVPR